MSIHDSAKIYKDVILVESNLEANTFVGDGSKLDHCNLKEYSRSGKYNHLYYVELGRHTYTGQNTVIMHTQIGNFTSIAWNVTIGAAEHDFNRVTSHTFLYNPYDNLKGDKIPYDRFEKECKIENDVWIGANSSILRGVTIGDGAVIGANSIVTKDVPPYAIVAGNPARFMKYRFSEDIVEKLLEIKWWDISDEIIKEYYELFTKNPTHEVLNEIERIKF